jgi:hypothetical protein
VGRPYSDESTDPNALWRFDEFNNTSYVESMIALALSDNLDDYEKLVARFRTPTGEDWALHNIQGRTLRDITDSLATYAPASDCLQKLKGVPVEVLYLSRESLTDEKFLARLPSGLVATFVGGKDGAVHRGLLIRKTNERLRKTDGRLYFRHASAKRGAVVEEVFTDFVNAQPEFVGVNLLSPVPQRIR